LKKESSFSEEKEAKRLLSVLSRTFLQAHANKQKFFGSFFQKRTLLSLWPTRPDRMSGIISRLTDP
jgi:hypothetical protein